jgi:hypothetical protein
MQTTKESTHTLTLRHVSKFKVSPLCYSIMLHAYTNSIASRIHVNITKLCNITCTLVATGVVLQSFSVADQHYTKYDI